MTLEHDQPVLGRLEADDIHRQMSAAPCGGTEGSPSPGSMGGQQIILTDNNSLIEFFGCRKIPFIPPRQLAQPLRSEITSCSSLLRHRLSVWKVDTSPVLASTSLALETIYKALCILFPFWAQSSSRLDSRVRIWTSISCTITFQNIFSACSCTIPAITVFKWLCIQNNL